MRTYSTASIQYIEETFCPRGIAIKTSDGRTYVLQSMSFEEEDRGTVLADLSLSGGKAVVKGRLTIYPESAMSRADCREVVEVEFIEDERSSEASNYRWLLEPVLAFHLPEWFDELMEPVRTEEQSEEK